MSEIIKTIDLAEKREIRIYSGGFDVVSDGWRLFSFNVSSPVNKTDMNDCDTSIFFEKEENGVFTWIAESTVWNEKKYILEIRDGAFVFSIKVKGHGFIENIEFFKGNGEKPGSRFSTAGYLLLNCQNRDYERSKYLMDVEPASLIPLRAAPPATIFPFWNDMNSDILGIGIAAKPKQHNYQEFIMHSPRDGWTRNKCWFELPLCGYTEVKGEWTSQMLWGGFANSDMEVLTKFSVWQQNAFGYKIGITAENAPKWWKGPMFCGWGEQCYLRDFYKCKSDDLASQKIYTEFSEKLDKLELHPTVIMIDDKWQENYGTLVPDSEKWPDLRGFADEEHKKGRHVVLWLKAWDTEGLPDDECIMLNGKAFSVDPTNPKYLARLEHAVYKLLSSDEGCFNCDGFKVDFMDMFPRVSGAQAFESGVFGLEMMRRLFEAIYRFAKAAKPDALINMSSCHPYFMDICDQFRIHDYDSNLRNPVSIMKYRVDFVSAIMPDKLIDMDGFSGQYKEDTVRCAVESAKLGVPDLYFLPDFFTEEDWDTVRSAWKAYSDGLK